MDIAHLGTFSPQSSYNSYYKLSGTEGTVP